MHEAENRKENCNNASEKGLGCFVCKSFFVDALQKSELDKHIREKVPFKYYLSTEVGHCALLGYIQRLHT